MPDDPITRRQPFKALYIVYLVISLLFVKLPWWSLYYLPRRNRPRTSWTLRRTLIVTIYRKILTPLPFKLNLDSSYIFPNSDNELKNAKFLWIDGLNKDPDVFCGEVRRAAGVTGVTPRISVPVYWIFKPNVDMPDSMKAREGERVAMHIHGGAFHLGSAHPNAPTSELAHGVLAHSTSLDRVLTVDYRLAAAYPDTPANPFPAALLDCITAYRYLIKDLGFEAHNITIMGDSAGGSLAFALVRHLVENNIPGLPVPGRLLGCSSLLDFSLSRKDPHSSLIRNYPTDILGLHLRYMFDAYLGAFDFEEAKTNRYMSPVSPHIEHIEGEYRNYPRTYLLAGGAEGILDDSIVGAERLEKDGVDVVLDVVPDAIHDFTNFPWHEPERTEAFKRICGWIDA